MYNVNTVQHAWLLIFESPRENWTEVFVVCIENKEVNTIHIPNSNTYVTNPGYSIGIKRGICLFIY